MATKRKKNLKMVANTTTAIIANATVFRESRAIAKTLAAWTNDQKQYLISMSSIKNICIIKLKYILLSEFILIPMREDTEWKQ